MSTNPNPHWHCYLSGFGTGCLGNHTQVLSISLTWGALGNVWWHAMTNFPLPGLRGKIFSLPTCFFDSSYDVSSSLMCPNRCHYKHSWTRCLCLYLQMHYSHEQTEGLKKTKLLSNCAGVINNFMCPFHVAVQELKWETPADLSRKERALFVWLTVGVISSTQKDCQWDFSIKHYL